MMTSCSTISRQILHIGNTSSNRYPAAHTQNPLLEKPQLVDLSQYKSVNTRGKKQNNLVIALAASGGGYRAANFTLGVLLGLEKYHNQQFSNNFLQEIDYFSTVSGGGFAVGYYLTQLHNYLIETGNVSNFSLKNNARFMLENKSNPLRQDLTPYLFFGKNRGLNLEKRINETLLATSDGGLLLGDVFVPRNSSRQVRLPYWFTNTTIFQNAVGFAFSPDMLKRYRITYFYHNNIPYKLRRNFDDLEYAYGVPYSVGVTASASVPFAIPPTTLISNGCEESSCYLQLMDGGLSDNLGVYTSLGLLLQDKSKIKILIIVDASKTSTQPFSQLMMPPTNVALLWRLASVSTDSNFAHIKPNIGFVARDLLCESGASNVIVISLDLSHYPQAQRIGTQLNLSTEAQKYLIAVGQETVMKNPVIKKMLAQLQRGHLTLGQCPRGNRE
jgi:predicted acylesterase/phospholipase RssA